MHVMNPKIGPHSEEHDYLEVAARLLIILGIFHLMFSIIAMAVVLFSPTISLTGETGLLSMLNFSEGYFLQTLVVSYAIFQIFLGWAVGLLTLQAARECLYTGSWHFVFRVLVLNWFCFPAGTTVGLMIWRDLRHQGIRKFFEDA